MKHPDYDSPSSLKAYLAEHGMAMQKRFGQNFLINPAARKKLIDFLDITEKSSVWEVGPGLGAMTVEMLSRNASVTAFEIDNGFAESILSFFSSYAQQGKFYLVKGDVLKTWKKQMKTDGIPDRFFGNLPYNIAAAIIGDMISSGIRFEKMVVTVQKEVADRMCARPGDKDYSSFSVLCSWAYDVIPCMDLSGGNFWPKPNVASRAVVMTKKSAFPACENPVHFQKLIRALFAARRKTVKNNLTTFYQNSETAGYILAQSGIDPTVRAEKLSLQDMLRLSDTGYSYILKHHDKFDCR